MFSRSSIRSPMHSGWAWPWCRTVAVRDPHAPRRQCTSLELMFDLCFVVAVAALVVELHHAVVDGHVAAGVGSYVLLFLPICWAWMLFSWFATAFDNDDVVYRLLTLVQMAGVLTLTATVPAAYHGHIGPFALCYVLMRLPLLAKWARAAHRHMVEHRYAARFTAGLAAGQLGWLVLLAVPEPARPAGVLVLIGLELAVPPWATAAARRQVYHAQHISERFGLFTMIVIGESILAAATALSESLKRPAPTELMIIGAASLLAAFSVWWLYFDVLDGRATALHPRRAFWWGHGHLVSFGAIGAMGAAAEVAVSVQTEALTFDVPMRVMVAAPAGLVLVALAWIHALSETGGRIRSLSRAAAGAAAVAAGVAAGEGGPAATVLALMAVLALQAAAETAAQGVWLRRAASGHGAASSRSRWPWTTLRARATTSRRVSWWPPNSRWASTRWAWAMDASVT
jgi:low temperature requirement protein LtrA